LQLNQFAELSQLDRLVGLSMLIAATAVFLYYTIWTLFMVSLLPWMNEQLSSVLVSAPVRIQC
jgi:hypothetical protein